VIRCQGLSVFGYSQDVQYGKLYHSILATNGTISNTELLTFTPGCYNDCPKFSSVYDSYGGYVYLKITLADNPDVVDAFSINQYDALKTVWPNNERGILFYANGTAYFLRDNTANFINSYSVESWNAYTLTSSVIASITNSSYSIYRAAFSKTTLYALDRDNEVLLVWPFTSTPNNKITAIPLRRSNVWVNSIQALQYSFVDSCLYGIDKSGSAWMIDVNSGSVSAEVNPQWPNLNSIVDGIQLAVDPVNSQGFYYLGYDTSINSYQLVSCSKKAISSIPLRNALFGLQWIGLTNFYI